MCSIYFFSFTANRWKFEEHEKLTCLIDENASSFVMCPLHLLAYDEEKYQVRKKESVLDIKIIFKIVFMQIELLMFM